MELLEEKGLKQVECVITDYRMPELSGLDLVKWISERDSDLSVMMMTAEGDKSLVTNALREGIYDFIDKPCNYKELRELVHKAVANTGERRAASETLTEINAITELQSHLNITTERQSRNDSDGDAVKIDIRMYPIKELGGDFINSFTMSDGRICVVVGDISGHDLKAGFISAYFQGMIRGMSDAKASVDEILHYFNRHLIDDWNAKSENDMFAVKTSIATCMLLVDLNKKEVEVVNYGIPNPIGILDNLGVKELISSAPPLGWFSDLMDNRNVLNIEDFGITYIWSDGLDDFADMLGISSMTVAARLLSIKTESERLELLQKRTDDVMLVSVRWGLSKFKDSLRLPFFYAQYSGGTDDNIDTYEKKWIDSMAWFFPELKKERLLELSLCIREGVINAIKHGLKGDSDKLAHLTLSTDRDKKQLFVSIKDEGEGFSSDLLHGEDIPDETGHISYGIRILKGCCKTCEHLEGGTLLNLSMDLIDS